MVISSCRNSKELVLLKDVQPGQMIPNLNDSITEYLIKPGDILYVSIKSMNSEVNTLFNPEASMEQQSYNSYQKYSTPESAYLYGFEVDEDGNLKLPILGKIAVAGHNQQDVQRLVQQTADHYLKEAIVKVKLLNYKVTVLGEVSNPGVYYNYNNHFNVLEAIAMANGNTNYANIEHVLVVRPQEGGPKAVLLNLSRKAIWKSEYFYLHPNDFVYVEPAKNKNIQLNSTAYSVTLSSISVLLALLGLLF